MGFSREKSLSITCFDKELITNTEKISLGFGATNLIEELALLIYAESNEIQEFLHTGHVCSFGNTLSPSAGEESINVGAYV